MSNTAEISLGMAVLTISDTRTTETDTSGQLLVDRIEQSPHRVESRRIIHDEKDRIRTVLEAWIDRPEIQVILTTGGTGLTGRDVTTDVVDTLTTKSIPGFGELFRWLSYRDIGTSTIQSRATAGVAKGTLIFALPGSTPACRTAWDEILVHQFDANHKPCNFVHIMERLDE